MSAAELISSHGAMLRWCVVALVCAVLIGCGGARDEKLQLGASVEFEPHSTVWPLQDSYTVRMTITNIPRQLAVTITLTGTGVVSLTSPRQYSIPVSATQPIELPITVQMIGTGEGTVHLAFDWHDFRPQPQDITYLDGASVLYFMSKTDRVALGFDNTEPRLQEIKYLYEQGLLTDGERECAIRRVMSGGGTTTIVQGSPPTYTVITLAPCSPILIDP